MTVADLREALKFLDADTEVRTLCSCHTDDICTHEVESIEVYRSLRYDKMIVRLHQGEIAE